MDAERLEVKRLVHMVNQWVGLLGSAARMRGSKYDVLREVLKNVPSYVWYERDCMEWMNYVNKVTTRHQRLYNACTEWLWNREIANEGIRVVKMALKAPATKVWCNNSFEGWHRIKHG